MPTQKLRKFKYPKEYVRHRLEEMIASGKLDAGGMIPSEQALADMLGVSRTPVRTVIKDMTKKGLLRQVDSRGYVVNRGKRFPANPMEQAVVLVSDFPAGGLAPRSMPGNIHWGVQRAAGRRERNIFILYDVKTLADPAAVRWFVENRPAGVLATSYISENPANLSALEAIRDAGVPVVVPGDNPHLRGFDRVVVEQATGAYELLKYLVERGCRRVVRLSMGGQDVYWNRARDRGYRKALKEADFDAEAFFVDEAPNVEYNPKSIEPSVLLPWTTGVLAPRVLDPKNPIDAVICPSDGQCELFGRALETLTLQGKREILVAGFDNYWPDIETPETRAYRPAATVDTSPALVGEAMVELLQARIDKKVGREPQLRKVRPTLIVLDEEHRQRADS